jgi:hypothetical protein
MFFQSLFVIFLTAAAQPVELRSAGSEGCTVATGNITVEVGNLEVVRKELAHLVKSNTVIVKNYSEYNNSRNKRSLNASYEVKKAAAQAFMDGIGGLGRVTSRNYGDQCNPGYNLESMQRKLDSYRAHLRKLLSAPGADPEIVALLDQQI